MKMPAEPKQDFKKEFENKRDVFMTNGVDDDEEFEKSAAVEADVKDMEKRKRVSLILNSEAFRQELETIVESQLKNGPHPASLYALQHLADLLLPSASKGAPGGLGAVPKDVQNLIASSVGQGRVHVPPIADLRGIDASGYSKGERFLRCKLASLFRLVHQQGWSEGVLNHISARVAGEDDSLLINPLGLQYHELTASSLVKLDSHGNVVNPGSTTFGVSRAGKLLHTAILQARPDLRCVLHFHPPDVQAVSTLKCGLMRLNLEACILGDISYHDFEGIILDDSEKETIARNLGVTNKIMLLRNHGAVVCGSTVEETWQLTSMLVHACQTQLKSLQAVGGNHDNLVQISDEVAQQTFNAAWSAQDPNNEDSDKQWRFGEMQFEALMRDLDNCGLRTGYIYKNPLVKVPTKQKFDVEIPPASSSMGYFSDSEALRNATRNGRDRYMHAGGYERIEADVFSDGDVPPETKVKWVRQEDKDANSKIDGPHQFTPVFSGKKEMKAKIGNMKDDRDLNKSNPGHHSRILDGLSENDARKYQEVVGVNQNAVAAFSKGVIQREYQKDAVLLTDYAAENPFDAVTDDEVERYRVQAERRAQGLPPEEPPSPAAAPPQDTKKNKKKNLNQSATMPAPVAQVTSDTETGVESGLDKGMTTGGETETEGTGTLDKKGKPAKKAKSFKLGFGKKK